VAIVGRLVERFGDVVEHDGRRFHAFPEARVVAGAHLDSLRACGLSLRKAETLRSVGHAIESGQVTEEKLCGMSSAAALRYLMELPGIGPWSAGLVLLRGMGRLDIFPAGDVGAARGLTRLMRLPPGSSLDRVLQRFGDDRGYLYFCSLGSALLTKNLIHGAPPRPSRRDLVVRQE
jgi:DNA-3-methyladenine glycosylase II